MAGAGRVAGRDGAGRHGFPGGLQHSHPPFLVHTLHNHLDNQPSSKLTPTDQFSEFRISFACNAGHEASSLSNPTNPKRPNPMFGIHRRPEPTGYSLVRVVEMAEVMAGGRAGSQGGTHAAVAGDRVLAGVSRQPAGDTPAG